MRDWWVNHGRVLVREVARDVALAYAIPALLRALDRFKHRLAGQPQGR
jgi:hypothetical protein